MGCFPRFSLEKVYGDCEQLMIQVKFKDGKLKKYPHLDARLFVGDKFIEVQFERNNHVDSFKAETIEFVKVANTFIFADYSEQAVAVGSGTLLENN